MNLRRAIFFVPLVACTRDAGPSRGGAPGSVGTPHTPGAVGTPHTAGAASSAQIERSAAPEPPKPPAADPLDDALARGRFVAITPVAGLAGTFEASLTPPDRREPVPARLALALTSAPTVHRRSLAFYRLARALGSNVVPAVVLRPIAAGELGRLLADRRDALELVRTRAVIQNDGTINAVLRPPAPAGGREIGLDGHDAAIWARWASSSTPLPGEDARILRGYVETLLLDYLSGNVLRRSVWLGDDGSIRLVESPHAFPLHADAGALDRTLRQLREVARFPRGLDVALRRLDRAGARALFCPGEFETWLLPPRSLVDLDERRAGLLTLIEARIGERSADAVLSL